MADLIETPQPEQPEYLPHRMELALQKVLTFNEMRDLRQALHDQTLFVGDAVLPDYDKGSYQKNFFRKYGDSTLQEYKASLKKENIPEKKRLELLALKHQQLRRLYNEYTAGKDNGSDIARALLALLGNTRQALETALQAMEPPKTAAVTQAAAPGIPRAEPTAPAPTPTPEVPKAEITPPGKEALKAKKKDKKKAAETRRKEVSELPLDEKRKAVEAAADVYLDKLKEEKPSYTQAAARALSAAMQKKVPVGIKEAWVNFLNTVISGRTQQQLPDAYPGGSAMLVKSGLTIRRLQAKKELALEQRNVAKRETGQPNLSDANTVYDKAKQAYENAYNALANLSIERAKVK